jgi:hypothetical protein
MATDEPNLDRVSGWDRRAKFDFLATHTYYHFREPNTCVDGQAGETALTQAWSDGALGRYSRCRQGSTYRGEGTEVCGHTYNWYRTEMEVWHYVGSH